MRKAAKQKTTTRERMGTVSQTILSVIGGAGLLGVAVLAPQVAGALEVMRPGTIRNDYIDRSLTRLVKQDLIKFVVKDGRKYLKVTDKGNERLLKYKLGQITIKKPFIWDGRWRMVMFDIKENRRRLRDELRAQLVFLGFTQVQKSVWVYPYDSEEVVVLLKSNFNLGREVLYVLADRLEGDKYLRKKYKLPV
jgi:phenylacetic acid degradation operon negative regulatory protein